MTDVSQEMAERLMAGARRDTSRGRYPEAVEQQREAVRVLEQGLASLAQDSPALADERKEYAHRLSNCWGRLGGIYRRADMIAEAVNAYQHGMEIERQYRLDDSYNITNWIVLQLLDDPLRLDDLTGEIEDAIALIEVQVQALAGTNGGRGQTSGCSTTSTSGSGRPGGHMSVSSRPMPGEWITSPCSRS